MSTTPEHTDDADRRWIERRMWAGHGIVVSRRSGRDRRREARPEPDRRSGAERRIGARRSDASASRSSGSTPPPPLPPPPEPAPG